MTWMKVYAYATICGFTQIVSFFTNCDEERAIMKLLNCTTCSIPQSSKNKRGVNEVLTVSLKITI